MALTALLFAASWRPGAIFAGVVPARCPARGARGGPAAGDRRRPRRRYSRGPARPCCSSSGRSTPRSKALDFAARVDAAAVRHGRRAGAVRPDDARPRAFVVGPRAARHLAPPGVRARRRCSSAVPAHGRAGARRPRRAAGARPRHRGQLRARLARRPAARGAGRARRAARRRGAEPRPRGARVRPTGTAAPALGAAGQRGASASSAGCSSWRSSSSSRHRSPASSRAAVSPRLMLELRAVSYRYAGLSAPGDRGDRPARRTTARSSASSGRTRRASPRCAWSPSGLAPASIGGELTGDVLVDGVSLARPGHARARRPGRHRVLRTPRASCRASPATRLRGGRLRAGQPRAAGRRDGRAGSRRARGGRHRGSRRAPAGPPVRRADAARRHRLDARDAPTCLVLDEPVAELDPRGRERSSARPLRSLAAPARRCSSPSTTSSSSRPSARGSSRSTAGASRCPRDPLRGPRLRLPGRHARARRARPVDRARRAGRDRRPERLRQVDARPALERPAPANRRAGADRRRADRRPSRRPARAPGRAHVPGPGSQLFARTCRDEVAFGARNVGLRGRSSRPQSRTRSMRSGWPTAPRRIPTTSGPRAAPAGARARAGDAHPDRRARRADDGPRHRGDRPRRARWSRGSPPRAARSSRSATTPRFVAGSFDRGSA